MVKQRSTGRSAAADVQATADDEARTFRAAVRDVTPLAQTSLSEGLAKPKPRARARRVSASATDSLDESMPLIGATPEQAITGDNALAFQRGGVRTQVMRRLRRGLLPIEAELDLHGLTQSAARSLLAEFIVHSRDAGCRCVRIIHGKGYRSGARGPVLKTAVNSWLRRHLDVIAFVAARAIDGGTGALYVLLRA